MKILINKTKVLNSSKLFFHLILVKKLKVKLYRKYLKLVSVKKFASKSILGFNQTIIYFSKSFIFSLIFLSLRLKLYLKS
jgi:hypothetical protein